MITRYQIVAARALLDWSQQTLSDESGIKMTTLSKLERGLIKQSRESTLSQIQHALQSNGIEFIDGGVRKRPDYLEVYEGDEGIRQFYNAVAEVAETQGGEFLVYGVDEDHFVNAAVRVGIQESYRERVKRANNTKFQVLIRKSDKNKNQAPHCTYRSLPDSMMFTDAPFYIFGNKLALIAWEEDPKFIIISHPSLVRSFRRQFKTLWKQAEGVK